MWIDHVSIKGKLHGVWQALYGGGVFDFKEINRRFGLSPLVGLAGACHIPEARVWTVARLVSGLVATPRASPRGNACFARLIRHDKTHKASREAEPVIYLAGLTTVRASGETR